MKTTHGKRSIQKKPEKEKNLSVARDFIEANTHHNITMKREFVYIEDVRIAVNINTLEERLKLKRWLISLLHQGVSLDDLKNLMNHSAESDRHRLQKDYRVTC